MSHSKEFPDGLVRCSWVTQDAEYLAYHDNEWGTETKDPQLLFEGICLEGFQAGLSWLTILKRRAGFRAAFADFDPALVANFTESDIERLLSDPGIIRNRAKIKSAINNARVVVEKQLDLTELLWSFAPKERVSPVQNFSWQATSAESDLMSKELKRLGFTFVGSTGMYALMQSTGMIFDHSPNCFRRG